MKGTRQVKRQRIYWQDRQGQSILEFSFCIVMVCLLLIGMVEVFSWMSRDLVMRKQAHDAVLVLPIGADQSRPIQQITPYFYSVSDMKGVPIMSNVYSLE